MGRPGTLLQYTQENSFYELASSGLLIIAGTYITFKAREFKLVKIKYALMITGFVFVLGGLEEISWGQQLFGFESHALFAKNQQGETNLHNFVPAWAFGLLVNLTFYIAFVFIPIFIYLFDDRLFTGNLSKYRWLTQYMPDMHLVLVFCFGFSLQKYFIVDTYADTVALLVALILLSIVAIRKKHMLFTAHLTFVILATLYFMLNHEIFNFENHQYEIREFIFIYAMIYWFLQTITQGIVTPRAPTKTNL